jgi:hypothetical protein
MHLLAQSTRLALVGVSKGIIGQATFGSPQSAMEPAKRMREHERKNQDACAEDKDMPGPPQLEVSDPAHEQVGNSKVQESPQDVYGR